MLPYQPNPAATIKSGILAVLFVLLIQTMAFPTDSKPAAISPKDKCPVCGMFVAKYPDFAAQTIFRNGSYAVFDGAKDMFKYFLDPGKYTPGKKQSDIVSIFVTDYYSLGLVNGYKAYYVSGSDVFGPMGRELIPFGKRPDAIEFMKDHKGRAILTFPEINAAIIKNLD